MDSTALLDPGATRLVLLAERCLHESASRRLDGEIYGAIHYIEDANTLSDDKLLEARDGGFVLVRNNLGIAGWIEAPPLTSVRRYAESLLPEGLATICRHPRLVCAAALRARALTGAAPPRFSNVFEFCRG
jgi:hypothetical protein